MRENLHCWRAGATATPLSSLNHSSLPRPTLFVIASCASCVTTACSIDVKAHNIILTFHVARRRADRTPSFAKNKACACLPQVRGTQAFEGLSQSWSGVSTLATAPLSLLGEAASRKVVSAILPPVTMLFLSIDRSDL